MSIPIAIEIAFVGAMCGYCIGAIWRRLAARYRARRGVQRLAEEAVQAYASCIVQALATEAANGVVHEWMRIAAERQAAALQQPPTDTKH